jgi:O-antigen/teichoic acid export membrane protein
MSLKRILKLLLAFLTGQGVSVITQLLVPPLFLHRYANGIEVYGEWITLTAAVAYLNTLNYGIQNYASNQVTIHYNRGEVEEARAVQASAFRLVLVAVLLPAIASAALLLMPLSQWLGLKHVGSFAASMTVFLLVLQLVTNWCFLLIASSYMAVGEAHRGTNWLNAQRLVAALALAEFLWNRASFPVLALTQLVVTFLFAILVVVDMRIRVPILLPAWRLGSWRRARAMAAPTGWFALLSVSGFLQWQGPVLVIQKILGPTSVAIFALTRVIFNMSRQFLSIVTTSIGQEITHLVGQKNWTQLRRLYELSEKVVLLLIPTMTIGTLLMAPFLYSVWLHKRSLYEPAICFTMAAISAVMGIKEHKYQFQWSSNEHTNLSRFTLIAYAVMLGLSVPLLKAFGIEGFLGIWMITEIAHVVYILHLNTRLFPKEVGISTAPVIRLGAVLVVAFALAAWPCWRGAVWPLPTVVGVAVAATAAVALTSYFLFDLGDVVGILQSRLRRRMAVVE